MEDLVNDSGLRIAVLGGTSPLGQDLCKSAGLRGHRLSVFSRSPLSGQLGYAEFASDNFDLVLNLIGGHKVGLSDSENTAVLELDDRIASECETSSTPYVHLSSGAVFGPLSTPASSSSPFGGGTDLDAYSKLKVELEQRHARARLRGAPISDFRLFSFTGPKFLEQSDYFLSLALQSIKSGKVFSVEGPSFLRDFAGPEEIIIALESAYANSQSGAFNLYSSKPISREELLAQLQESFGLRFAQHSHAADSQKVYCAEPDNLIVGYKPRSSIGAILDSFRECLAVAS